ncbi:MAG: biotin/lipoyl-containing protein, partial [Psychrobacillus sp.]
MIDVKLHDIGEGMTEGEVIHYLVKVGDRVQTDQPLVEVQTDKMVAELTSPCTGIVKEIRIAAGEMVKVGTSLLSLESEGGGGSSTEQYSKDISVETSSNQPLKEDKSLEFTYKRILATPYTRKIAREHNINLEDVTPSDPSGRITEEDVMRFIDNKTEKKIIPEKIVVQ